MASSTRRPKEDQNLWNFYFSLFFLLVLIAALRWFWVQYQLFPQSVSVFDFILMALAAFRVTRLIVYDKITRWFRELFMKKEEYEQDGVTWVQLTPYPNGFFGTIHDLLGCPWCIGFWSAIIIAFFYFVFPWAWFVILFLALAGTGSFVQLAANMIGWQAENLKLDAKEKEERTRRKVDLTSLGK